MFMRVNAKCAHQLRPPLPGFRSLRAWPWPWWLHPIAGSCTHLDPEPRHHSPKLALRRSDERHTSSGQLLVLAVHIVDLNGERDFLLSRESLGGSQQTVKPDCL